MADAREQPAQPDVQSRPTGAEEAQALTMHDVHSGRAFGWQVEQDRYERWLNDIAP